MVENAHKLLQYGQIGSLLMVGIGMLLLVAYFIFWEELDMGRYKVNYTYSEFSNNIHGKRVNSYDEYEADNPQEAIGVE